MNIHPLHDRVAVKRHQAEEKTTSGIILSPAATEASYVAEVIAVGEGRVTAQGVIPMTVKVGDKVLLGKFAGQSVKVEGEEFTLINETDIVAVLKD